MYVCINLRMYVCMYVCVYMYMCMYVLARPVPGVVSPGWLHFVRWRQTCVGPQYSTCIMSPVWRPEFCGSSSVLENLCASVYISPRDSWVHLLAVHLVSVGGVNFNHNWNGWTVFLTSSLVQSWIKLVRGANGRTDGRTDGPTAVLMGARQACEHVCVCVCVLPNSLVSCYKMHDARWNLGQIN